MNCRVVPPAEGDYSNSDQKSEKDLENRLRLFDESTLRQELRSVAQLARVGVERSGLPSRESLYDRGCWILKDIE